MKQIDGEKLVKALREKAKNAEQAAENFGDGAMYLALLARAGAIHDIADAIESSLTPEEGEKVNQ